MNLNIFKRIADLEADIGRFSRLIDGVSVWALELSDKLAKLQQAKQTDADKIAKRKAYARAYYEATKAKRAKPGPKPIRTLQTLEEIRNKRREYARKYYAQKKAAKAAA